jgi:CubicO group peptidase (beta-lactamase class C family)
MRFAAAQALIDQAISDRACPAAVVDVGRASGPVWQYASGALTYDSDAPACTPDTVFDLASLTKVIATASIAMRAVAAGGLSLDMPIGDVFPEWDNGDRRHVHVRHLLDHSSGLPAHARLWTAAAGRAEYREAIDRLTLERAPGVASVYSDPGYILLGLLLEHVGRAPLDYQFGEIASRQFGQIAGKPAIGYLPPPDWQLRIAPTEFDEWRGRLIKGEVHDENAAAMGGVAGHAGLFGTAPAVGAFAQLVLRSFVEKTDLGPAHLMRTFATRTDVPHSSRALGWDTMLSTSSCGTRMSAAAIGHTGFTGTSLWIDPAKDLYVVLLTNRVYPTRSNSQWASRRPGIHDAIVDDLVPGLG